ncbi:MAG TPA: PEGA domain-containing protein [Polyangiaceae bacterium]|jgi:serine/threonine-protein kinase|nr:PEGA domain-containing protein [Polyangiaceae bacterium]
MKGDSKGSGLDIFDSLGKRESTLPSESGVVQRGPGSKAPPPPPTLNRGSTAPMPPPSLASLAAPVARASKPPPPPSSLRPPPPSMRPPKLSGAPPPPSASLSETTSPDPEPEPLATTPSGLFVDALPPGVESPFDTSPMSDPPSSLGASSSGSSPRATGSSPRASSGSSPRATGSSPRASTGSSPGATATPLASAPPSPFAGAPSSPFAFGATSSPLPGAPQFPPVSRSLAPPPPPPSPSRSLAPPPPPPTRSVAPPPPPPPSVPTADDNPWPSSDGIEPPSLDAFDGLAAPGAAKGPPLAAYSGDPEDDAPTRLYAPSSQPPLGITATRPRNDKPQLTNRAPALRASQGSRFWPPNKLYVVGGALGVLVASLILYFSMRTGTLLVTVSGPGGHAIDSLEVFVDGAKRCDASPCTVNGLPSGAHLVRAAAKGYEETAEQAVAVEKGQQAIQTILLSPLGAGTGIRVSALGSGLKLFVDGQEYGELPQTAKGIAPGTHTLRVAGSDRYQPWEEQITLDDGELKNVGPLRLKVLKGLATFKAGAGADGARVLLDGRMLPELPATIEVPAGKQLTLLATKAGYSTYRRTIGFNDGVAEKTFEITMVEGSGDEPLAAAASPSPSPSPAPVAHAATAHHASALAETKTSSAPPGEVKGKSTLNLNSIPVSNVILNGRPLGQTPKVGVSVPPGPQTVVFVHPDLGRKVMSGTVAAGETKTFLAKFR